MMIGRTAAKRGSKTTWYVYADRAAEQRAIREGLLEERAPDVRWRFVLAWGFRSKREAEAALEELRPAVEEAVEAVESYLGVEPAPGDFKWPAVPVSGSSNIGDFRIVTGGGSSDDNRPTPSRSNDLGCSF